MRQDFIEERLPRGISLDRLSNDDCSVINKKLGLAGSDKKKLAQQLADPAFLRAQLVKLPALCLAVLEAVVEAGGISDDTSLRVLVAKRTGRSVPEIATARQLLFGHGLILGLDYRQGVARTQTGVSEPAWRPLYALLAGVSLPDDAPPNEAHTAEPNRKHRDLLALTTLSAHRKLRLTQFNVPDRASLKRLVKGLSVPVDDAERAFVLATRLGWMVGSHDGIAPDASALLKAARGEIETSGIDALRCTSLITAENWTGVEALERALSYASSALGYVYAFHARPLQTNAKNLAQQLAELPGFEVVEHAGAHFVRRRRSTHAGGDGHVTPSFEVLLGPGADLATVVRVGLCCELVRIDHVLIFRLTPQSIANAIACGLDPSELRNALASVGPHGLPDNVAFMVEDWIKSSRVAKVRSGTFLFTDDATAERIALSLGDEVMSRPAQGVIELRGSFTGSGLEKALSKAGVALAATGSVRAVANQRRADRYAQAPHMDESEPTLPLLPLPQPDAELRAIVLRAKKSGDYGVKAAETGESDALLPRLESIARAQGAPAELFELLNLVRKWQKRMPDELRPWIERLPQAKQSDAYTALELPLNLLPWLVLNEQWRLQVLKMARDVEGLIRQAVAASAGGRFRPEGERAKALLLTPQVTAAIDRALDALDASDAVGDEDQGVYCEDCGQYHGRRNLDGDLDEDDLDDDDLDDDEQDAATLRRQPPIGAMPRTAPETVLALVGTATEEELPVHLEVTDGGKTRVYSVHAEALRRRGHDQVLLATDLESLEPRVFKLKDIVAACIDAP